MGEQGVPPLRAASGARVNADVGCEYVMKIIRTIVLTLLIVGGIIFWIRIGILVAQQTKTLNVTGHVEDSATGARIPNAKVIATAWDYGIWDASPHKYGITTDSNGQFTITAHMNFWIARIDVYASSPDNRYDQIMKLKGYAPLSVRDLTYWQTNSTAYLYDSFSGSWVGNTTWIRKDGTQPAGGAYGSPEAGSPTAHP